MKNIHSEAKLLKLQAETCNVIKQQTAFKSYGASRDFKKALKGLHKTFWGTARLHPY